MSGAEEAEPGQDDGHGAEPAERSTRVERPELPATRFEGLTNAPLMASIRSAAGFLRTSRLGLVVMALVVGVVAGFGAVGFRELIFLFTWIVTGHSQFGQQGRVGSSHFPGVGIWFLLFVPVLAGLLYGPLIQRFAKEARGHGVPEVMLAVAENGGRIRPQVTVVKALASALCIGAGGSVGREGPIVQIGSAFASTLGQWVRMSESRLRVLVACGAAGGIAATFNAPITGMFFGFEIVLREFSLDALFATILSASAADLISRAFYGSAPFFSGMPHNLVVTHDYSYLLIAVLGVASGLLGWGFKTFLYKLEDLFDALWRGRPEWARPAVGGLGLGLLLLALPQMYGVGYPVMNRVVAGHYVLWFVALLVVGKIAAASLTLAIGGSGGVFAPSLFTGATAGMAFGVVATHLFGHVVSTPAIFAVTAMGGVFGAAAQAPLTAIASVVEMTGNFTLTLPVMLAVGIASAVSRRLSHGSIYTTKLLRRGVDIERVRPTTLLQTATVSDVMIDLPGETALSAGGEVDGAGFAALARVGGTVVESRSPQALFSDETLDQALRQLALYGRAGLPVLSPDGRHLLGWITRQKVLHALADAVSAESAQAEQGRLASEFSHADPQGRLHKPRTPLEGYEIVEVSIPAGSPALNRPVGDVDWPPGSRVVAVSQERELVEPRDDLVLRRGERVVLLVPSGGPPPGATLAAAKEPPSAPS
jgi:chloride channel protein, CIC family